MATVSEPELGLLTAEEFAQRPDEGRPEELVRGRVVTMPPPGARHGKICAILARLLGNSAEEQSLGHVLCNDAGVITARGPDTVRGPDVAFYRYERLARGALPTGYLTVVPDVVFEVMSPEDRWPSVLAKVAEYLNAGVGRVVILDPEERVAYEYASERGVRVLSGENVLEIPEVLGTFRVPVGRFFE